MQRRELYLTFLGLFGMLLVAVGAIFKPLYFMAWVGAPLTLGCFFAYYRELQKKRKQIIIGLLILPLIFFMSTTGHALATIYTAEDHEKWIYPNCSLYIALDDVTNDFTIKWVGSYAIILPLPAPYCAPLSYYIVEDDLGFKREGGAFIPPDYEALPPSGEDTFFYWNNGATWITAKFYWVYGTGMYWIIVDAVVTIYVPHIPLKGDINDDGMVDISDIVIVAFAFDSVRDNPRWNEDADLNGDGMVDISDIVIVARQYGLP